jgi:hypothetical protein
MQTSVRMEIKRGFLKPWYSCVVLRSPTVVMKLVNPISVAVQFITCYFPRSSVSLPTEHKIYDTTILSIVYMDVKLVLFFGRTECVWEHWIEKNIWI